MLTANIYSSSNRSPSEKLVNIPSEIKSLPRWTCFKFEPRPGQERLSKIPFNPITGQKAKSNDPTTWTSFITCVEAYRDGKYDGITMMMPVTPEGLVAIDIDDCVSPDKTLSKLAEHVIEEVDSYTEYSPSGTGIRIIARGVLPKERRKDSELGFEIYDSVRPVTMTGNRIEGTREHIREATAEIQKIHKGVFPQAHEPKPTLQPVEKKHQFSDDQLIEKIRKSATGPSFDLLMRGDLSAHNDNHSDADYALCKMLAWWTERDPLQMDSIFRQSLLMREKWDKNGGYYRNITINNAIKATNGCYDPDAKKPEKVEAKPETPPPPSVGKKTSSAADILKYLSANAPWKQRKEAVAYLIEPEIPKGCLIMISGEPASGKSTLVMSWCLQMAQAGNDVLYLDRDNSKQVVQERFERYSNVSDHFKYWGLWACDSNGEPLEPPLPENELITDCVKAMNNPVIVFDTFNSFSGADENDNSAIGRTYKAFRKLCTTYGATVIVIHHTTKDGNSPYRGASSQAGAIDMGWVVVGKKDTNSGKLTYADVRNWKTRRADGATISYKFDDKGIPTRVTKTFNDLLFELLTKNPGLTAEKFETLARQELKSTRTATKTFLDAYMITRKIKREGSKLTAVTTEPEPTAIDELVEAA